MLTFYFTWWRSRKIKLSFLYTQLVYKYADQLSKGVVGYMFISIYKVKNIKSEQFSKINASLSVIMTNLLTLPFNWSCSQWLGQLLKRLIPPTGLEPRNDPNEWEASERYQCGTSKSNGTSYFLPFVTRDQYLSTWNEKFTDIYFEIEVCKWVKFSA